MQTAVCIQDGGVKKFLGERIFRGHKKFLGGVKNF